MSAQQEVTRSPARMSCVERLEQVFMRCFGSSLCTRLQGGAAEPLYQPATLEGDYHVLYYRADYFASALHEVAHWCIAGEIRRQQTDFGYWYAPDGRSPAQQRAFERVECRPQALEWMGMASGRPSISGRLSLSLRPPGKTRFSSTWS